jgi:acetyltransferase-like isoleucine patch superfamily enzyme
MPGCYIQGVGKIEIGDYTQISSNVGMITANHDLSDSTKHIIGEIKIGKYCWIGMNAVILPNVFIGDYALVVAGSVVTKSFPDGYCVIAGNPAKIIKELPLDSVNKFENDIKYIGYNKIVL